MKNVWLDGMMGLVVGDALGCPVQFLKREELAARPVTEMEGHGTYNKPKGTWTDDGSMALATLDDIVKNGYPNPGTTMKKFCDWLLNGKYTQGGVAFDNGNMCTDSICRFLKNGIWQMSGGRNVNANGNGSLMRILPVCIYNVVTKQSDGEAVQKVFEIGGLTHNHPRALVGCGLYYFMVKAVMEKKGKSLFQCMQNGLDEGFNHFAQYGKMVAKELDHYTRIANLAEFEVVDRDDIKSTGYIVDTLEAAVWSLITENTYKDAMLTAVNLGDDTDSVAAVAGGIAGLYYGIDGIPKKWLKEIYKSEMVTDLCDKANAMW